jgi:hypothetical protein
MAVYTVTTLNDEDLGLGGTGLSLREAIALADANAGADTIKFSTGAGTITLSLGQLVLASNIMIDGDIGADGSADITISGNHASRVFSIAADAALNGLTVRDGDAGSADGGGIEVTATGHLQLTNASLIANKARDGGGLYAGAGAELTNVTIGYNTALGNGGGIFNADSLQLTNVTISTNIGGGGFHQSTGSAGLVNTTISGNVGGGIRHNDGSLLLLDSVVLGNVSGAELFSAAASAALLGGNIVGNQVFSASVPIGTTSVGAVFAAIDTATGGGLLADNGGAVQTIALKGGASNPATDAGLSAGPATDARGLSRVDDPAIANQNGSAHDLGAYELQPNAAPQNTVPATQTVEANTDGAISGLAVFDPDAGAATIQVTLSVLHGTLRILNEAVALSGGVSLSGPASSVTLTGPAFLINATLGQPGNVIYHGDPDFFGVDTLTMTTSDLGATGTGGPLSDTDQVTINVKTLLAGTPDDDAFAALPGNERIDAGGGTDTIAFNFKLTDATVRHADNTVVIDGPAGSHTVLTGFERFVFTDGTVNNADGNPLVDDLFYSAQNHDVWNAHVDADQHYNTVGWHEGRDPSAFFSTTLYLAANPDVKQAGVNPLTHFDQFGWREGRVASLDFDPREYLATYADVAAAHIDPLWHFLAAGASEGRLPFAPPSALLMPNGFDFVYYLHDNPDVAAAGVDPFWHFQAIGWTEGRNPNALFDTAGYLAAYSDVAAAHINPLDHYNMHGWHEGRDPSVDFDTSAYLAANADVAAAHVNPLLHYLQFGQHEGRSAQADGVWG